MDAAHGPGYHYPRHPHGGNVTMKHGPNYHHPRHLCSELNDQDASCKLHKGYDEDNIKRIHND